MSTEFHLIDFVSVLAQAEKLGLHVSRVPHRHAFIAAACNHQILVERRVVDRHDLGNMGIDGFRGSALSHVPDLELLIVTHRRKLIFIVLVPADIFNDV